MRAPDLYIGPKSNPQTSRWHLLRWRGWQIALHRWHRSDDDRALHDHSGHNLSILLTGCYTEIVGEWNGYGGRHQFMHRRRKRWPLVPYFRLAATPHRIEIDRPIWTIWVRWPPIREWGFHCPKGWLHWRDYINGDYAAPGSESTIGRGCD